MNNVNQQITFGRITTDAWILIEDRIHASNISNLTAQQ